MNSPLFSIVTVCRNAATSIDAAARSVVEQSLGDFEWIVIDGASTDQTLVKLGSYRSRIGHLISEPDRGIYDAMNKGLRLARGKWVYFLNADDVFAGSEVLARMVGELLSGRRMVYGNVVLHDPAAGWRKRVGKTFYRPAAISCRLPHHQAVFMDREWAIQVGGFNQRFGLSADVHLIGLALREASACYWVDLDVAHFRMGGASAKLATSVRDLRNQLRAISEAFGLMIGLLHSVFLSYYITKMFLLRRLRGTAFERCLRRWRMKHQRLSFDD